MSSGVSGLLLVVAVALVDAEGRVLVQQRPPGKPMAGLWEFPGGKVEPDEVPEAALTRELAEELGIAVETRALIPIAFASEGLGARHLLLLLYVAREWAGTPEPRHASALQWVRPTEMRALTMPPADVPLVDALKRLFAGTKA
ncbi:(deoxy)nucleoside triphosphate pyrophosphohydrolase [Sphingomonas sp. DG1-23]|uniref:(deoxy)nucleoside triphosphate pyrophosphohydrolase n=1 Tax=Sphingomonas sp. DG1-23 TaxID=3068316 RepID=UPI00273ED509|nr:(deoxy)nucleoside triphosphate pyrophosphohydrolase [Sphingomonas sp. DG1-23]MDP5281098.1 (deoxy)nucleoside triphosphate pyrophosphohydrolase [Sphingomonas sp. DG1-23]